MMNICKKVSLAISMLLLSADEASAAGYSKKYDYIFNGADWAFDGDSECGKTNQSPIDLRTPLHSEPFQMADGNEFNGTYNDLTKAKVNNKGKVIQVDMPYVNADGVSPDNYFFSDHSVNVLNGSKKYSAAQFHFHAKSEHTINGRRFDLEMHTVHLAEEKIDGAPWASAVGIIFDRYNYDPSVTAEERLVIDKFFDALNLDQAGTTVGNVKELVKDIDIPYGQLTKTVDFANRWAYSGSLTTPPCTVGVYFQVADRVLPISEKHYTAYLARQAEHTSVDYFDKNGANQVATALTTPKQQTLNVVGNWRITNKIDNHNVTYMRANFKTDEGSDPKTTTVVLSILLAISVVVAGILGFCACKLMKSQESPQIDEA